MLDMKRHTMWIGHREVEAEGGATFEVENPATETSLGTAPEASPADVGRAVDAARKAQAHWRRLPGAEKAKLLHEVATRIRGMGHQLAATMTAEGG